TPGCQPAGTTAALPDTSPWASLLTVGNTWGIVCIRSIRRRRSTRYSTILTYWGTRLSRLRLGASGVALPARGAEREPWSAEHKSPDVTSGYPCVLSGETCIRVPAMWEYLDAQSSLSTLPKRLPLRVEPRPGARRGRSKFQIGGNR